MTDAQFTALCERMVRQGLPVPASREAAEREAAQVLRRPEDSHEEWRARVAAVNAASGH